MQYAAFYDESGSVVLAKRKLTEMHWETHRTQYVGDIKDAHRTISIAVDGDGYIHMAWDHHDTRLRYCRGLSPGSLELGPELKMTGKLEDRVTYPEFYNLSDG